LTAGLTPPCALSVGESKENLAMLLAHPNRSRKTKGDAAMTPQAKAFWNKWALKIAACAVLLPLTVYQLFHNWGEWLFLAALGLGWFSLGYSLIRDIKGLRRVVRNQKPDPA
jgi:hypothetical protein